MQRARISFPSVCKQRPPGVPLVPTLWAGRQRVNHNRDRRYLITNKSLMHNIKTGIGFGGNTREGKNGTKNAAMHFVLFLLFVCCFFFTGTAKNIDKSFRARSSGWTLLMSG